MSVASCQHIIQKPPCYLSSLLVSLPAMGTTKVNSDNGSGDVPVLRSIINWSLSRSYSLIIWAALFCTLTVKLAHAVRYNITGDYFTWILSDVAFFLMVEVLLSLGAFAGLTNGLSGRLQSLLRSSVHGR